MKKILDVPYLSQFDDVSDVNWQSVACGVTSLAMVLKYYGTEVPIENLIEVGEEINSFSEKAGGWYHNGLCEIARRYGFIAWRRKWRIGKRDLDYVKEEGWTDNDVEQYEIQTAAEGIFTLEKSILKGTPPIISADKDFENENSGHLVVVTGFEREGEELKGFYINDPKARGKKRKDEFIYLKKFEEHWHKRGIFVIKG